MIPCMNPKCLKYPICRDKITIHCNLLSKHVTDRMIELREINEKTVDQRDIWITAISELRPYLPNVIPILTEKKK